MRSRLKGVFRPRNSASEPQTPSILTEQGAGLSPGNHSALAQSETPPNPRSQSRLTGTNALSSTTTAGGSQTSTVIAKGQNYGIKTLYDGGSTAGLDIVFVHGLTGNAYATWHHKDTGIHWPSQLLKQDIPDARILSFGYDADVVNLWNPASVSRLTNHGENMVGDLVRVRERTDSETRPILFVAHSLGGLVTEHALSYSRKTVERHLQHIERCTRGLVFLGVPHCGSDLAAWASLGTRIVSLVRRANKDIVGVLEPGSEMLRVVQSDFHNLLRLRQEEGSELAITCFYEELPVVGIGVIVPLHSAEIKGYSSYAIHANHMDMTKFPDQEDRGYDRIVGELRRWKKLVHEKGVRATPLNGEGTTSLPSHNVPFRQDENFVGQESVLSKIMEILLKPNRHNRAALYGLGGVGKSQIAIEFSYRLRKQHPHTWVFWVYASDAARFKQGFRQIASLVKIPGYDKAETDILRLVYDWLSQESNGRWLLILDNADDVETFFPKAVSSDSTQDDVEHPKDPLASFLPQTPNGCILVTSRNKSLAVSLVLGDDTAIDVARMDEETAISLLRKKGIGLEADESQCKELAHMLDYLPLALVQAAGYIRGRAPRITIMRYLQLLSEDRDSSILEQAQCDPRRDQGLAVAVLTTWRVSFEQLRRQAASAAELLSRMAVLERRAIPEFLFYEDDEGPGQEFEDALAPLLDFSLIVADVDNQSFSMHRLVQLATRRWLDAHGNLQRSQNWALTVIAEKFPMGEYENRSVCEKLLPHVDTVLKQASQDGSDLRLDTALIYYNYAEYCKQLGQYDAAEAMIRRALEVYEEELGSLDRSILYSSESLGVILRYQGNYKESEAVNRRALQGKEQVLGLLHRDTLVSVSNLALVLESQGKYEESEAMNRRALRGEEQVLGLLHPSTLASVNNLALVLESQGKYEESEAMNRRALQGTEQLLGLLHPDTLASVNNLAQVLESQGKYEESEAMNRRALQGKEQVLGLLHPDTLASVNNLAEVLQRQGKYEESEAMSWRALRGEEQVLGLLHPNALTSVWNLACTLLYREKRVEAQQLYERAYSGHMEILGPDHPYTKLVLERREYFYPLLDRAEEPHKRN